MINIIDVIIKACKRLATETAEKVVNEDTPPLAIPNKTDRSCFILPIVEMSVRKAIENAVADTDYDSFDLYLPHQVLVRNCFWSEYIRQINAFAQNSLTYAKIA